MVKKYDKKNGRKSHNFKKLWHPRGHLERRRTESG